MRLIALLALLLPLAASADVTYVVNTPTATWGWDAPVDGPIGPYYQIERQDGTQQAFTGGVRSFPVSLPDRTATTPARLRVRTCIDAFHCGAWSPWSDWAIGVPIGFDPDWDRDGEMDPLDFDAFVRAFSEGWTWQR